MDLPLLHDPAVPTTWKASGSAGVWPEPRSSAGSSWRWRWSSSTSLPAPAVGPDRALRPRLRRRRHLRHAQGAARSLPGADGQRRPADGHRGDRRRHRRPLGRGRHPARALLDLQRAGAPRAGADPARGARADGAHARRSPPSCAMAQERVVPVEELRLGDVVLIRPGERVAVDGTRAGRRDGHRPGGDHRRIDPGQQGRRRSGLRRHDQRLRRAPGAGRPPASGEHAGEDRPVRRAGAGGEERHPALHRPLRGALRRRRHRLLDAGRPRRRRCVFGAGLGAVDLPRHHPAGGRLALRAGDLHPGLDPLRPRQRRPQRHPLQRKRLPGRHRRDAHHRLRQDRHADRRPTGADRRRLAGQRLERGARAARWRRSAEQLSEHHLAQAIVRGAGERGLPLAEADGLPRRSRARGSSPRSTATRCWSATRCSSPSSASPCRRRPSPWPTACATTARPRSSPATAQAVRGVLAVADTVRPSAGRWSRR